MPRDGVNDQSGPTYTQIKFEYPAPSRIALSRQTLDQLKVTAGKHGLAHSGTRESLARDIQFFLDLGWGAKPKKVTVPKLRAVQGPRDVFGPKPLSPEKSFDVLFTSDMWQHITEQTNLYEGPRVRTGGPQSDISFSDPL